MNSTSVHIHQILTKYCNACSIARMTGNWYFSNLVENFGYDFDHYLRRNYGVRILSLESILKAQFRTAKKATKDDLCVYHLDTHRYRFLRPTDVAVIKAIIRKYYQDSHEINLRIRLLFDSKLGTKYLSRKTGVKQKLITLSRHGHIPIADLTAEDRLNLENFYLNSKLALHIRRLRATFE